MVCFEVHLNGKKVCLAGVGESGVLTAIVSWVGGSPESPRRGGRTSAGEARLSVTGLHNPEPHLHVHPKWCDEEVKPGDEMRIKVIEADSADVAPHAFTQSGEDIERQQREYYESVKARFESEPGDPE